MRTALAIIRVYLFLILLTLAASTGLRAERPATVLEDTVTPLLPLRPRTELETDQVRAAALAAEGRILHRRDQSNDALRQFQRAHRYAPNANAILQQIVTLALELNRGEQAARYAVLLADQEQTDPHWARQLAMLLTEHMDYPRALKMYERALELQSDQEPFDGVLLIHFEMGRLYYLTGRPREAAESFSLVQEAIDTPEEEHRLEPALRNALVGRPQVTYMLMAESYLQAGRTDAAAEMFRRAAQGQPKEWLDFQLARVAFKAGKADQAKTILTDYLEKKYDFAGTEPYDLLRQIKSKQTVTADGKSSIIEQFQRFRDADPNNLPLQLYLAALYREDGQLDRAAVLHEDLIKKRPTLTGYRALIASYVQSREIEKLLEVVSKAVWDARGIEALGDEAQTIVRDRQLLDALADLARDQTSVRNLRRARTAVAVGMLAAASHQYAMSDEFFEIATEARAIPWEILMSWGLELLLSDEPGRATEVFRTAISADNAPEQEAAFNYYLAAALQLSGDSEGAQHAARRAAELGRELPAFQIRLAWVLYHEQRHEEAEKAYLAWLDKHQANYSAPGVREAVRDAHFALSNICVADDRAEEAEEWLNRVLDEFPQDVGAMNDLGYLLVDQGKSLDRALRMIQSAVAAEPENVAYRDSLGWAYFRLNRYQEAVDELKAAVDTDDPDPIILDHLGDAQLATGNIIEAVAAWRRALRELKDNPSAVLQKEAIDEKIQTHSTTTVGSSQ